MDKDIVREDFPIGSEIEYVGTIEAWRPLFKNLGPAVVIDPSKSRRKYGVSKDSVCFRLLKYDYRDINPDVGHSLPYTHVQLVEVQYDPNQNGDTDEDI